MYILKEGLSVLTPSDIVFDGILQRSVSNYHPQIPANLSKRLPQVSNHLKQIIHSSDTTTVKRHSILYQRIKAYQKSTLGVVHRSYLVDAAVKGQQLKVIPVAVYLDGIFISYDDAQRFYRWLSINY